MMALVQPAKVEGECKDEENDGRILCRLRQDVAGIGAKRSLRRTSTQSSAHAAVFRLLHQDDQNEEDRNKDQDEGENSEEDAHVKGSEQQSGRAFVNRRLARRLPGHAPAILDWENCRRTARR
jgi:hypothetical protein